MSGAPGGSGLGGGGLFSGLVTQLNLIAQNLGRLVTQTALAVVIPVTQGGTGATTASQARTNLGITTLGTPNHLAAFATANSFQDGGLGGSYQLGALLGANFNVTIDQAILVALPPGASAYVIEAIVATHASVSLTTAVGGIYLGPSKTGLQVVSASQAYSGLTGTAINTAGSALPLTVYQGAFLSVGVVYFSLTTPQGVAATADLRVYGRALF